MAAMVNTIAFVMLAIQCMMAHVYPGTPTARTQKAMVQATILLQINAHVAAATSIAAVIVFRDIPIARILAAMPTPITH